MVVVNLRPDSEDATKVVRCDQAQVRRVLARIAADLQRFSIGLNAEGFNQVVIGVHPDFH
jgi:hypothetical protein